MNDKIKTLNIYINILEQIKKMDNTGEDVKKQADRIIEIIKDQLIVNCHTYN